MINRLSRWGISLGYNVVVHDAIELVNQVYFDIPGDDEAFSFGVMVGFIASPPGHR